MFEKAGWDKSPTAKRAFRSQAPLRDAHRHSVGDLGPKQPADIDAETAAEILNQRFASYFHETPIQVQVDDSMLADAAAGSDYVKIRSGAKFSQRDVDILEVHEGWVHVATSLNGQAQPVAKWLAKDRCVRRRCKRASRRCWSFLRFAAIRNARES